MWFTQRNALGELQIDGLRIAGQQAGYIYPKEYGEYSADATNSDGILFSENTAVPYWMYNKIHNDAGVIDLTSLRPPLKRADGKNSIESQLDRYVNENLKNCLGNYSVFTEQGYSVKEAGKVDATATVVQGHVTFSAKYPMDVSVGKVKSRISSFYADIPLDLYNIYSIAENITGLEQEYTFLERGTLNWITSFSAIDKNKLPPITDMDFRFVGTTFWLKENVEKNLKSMLSSYIPMFRIMPSRNFYRYEYPANLEYSDLMQRVYDDTIVNVNKQNSLDVRFDYLPLWPIYLNVDEDAGVIKPDSLSLSFPMVLFGVQNYKTVYDVSYPVMVSLNDPEALSGAGYSFSFALEANIRANQPVEDDEVLTPAVAFFESGMACNENQRNSIPYTINVKDVYDGTVIPEAQVFFGFGGNDCFIGETDKNGVLTSKLPIGYGGTLKIVKDNYLTASVLLEPKGSAEQLRQGEKTDIYMKMNRFDVVKISADKMKVIKSIKSKKMDKWLVPIVKYNPTWMLTAGRMGIPLEERKDVSWVFTPTAVPLQDNEMAVITLTRISDLEQPFSMAVTVTGKSSQEIRLVPGVYDIKIELFLDEEVIIPSEKRCYAKPGILPGQEECITVDAIEFEQFPNGGLEFNNASGYWQLNSNNIYPVNEIVFHAVSPAITDIPEESGIRVAEDLEQMGLTSYYSATYRKNLEPNYK